MKTSRLKSIIIMILALVNVFLLALLLVQRVQERAAFARRADELVTLCASSGVTLDASILPSENTSGSFDLTRDPERERSFADALLGSTDSTDSGGGIYRYYNADGSATFRSAGTLDASCMRCVDDVDTFCAALFSSFGYCETARTLTDGTGTVSAVRQVNGTDVFNATLILTFAYGYFRAAEGTFLPDVSGSGAAGLDAVTAVVTFLDYRNSTGLLCTEITGIQSGYLLQSTASAPLRLTGVWRIDTNVASYYVNQLTGDVSRV